MFAAKSPPFKAMASRASISNDLEKVTEKLSRVGSARDDGFNSQHPGYDLQSGTSSLVTHPHLCARHSTSSPQDTSISQHQTSPSRADYGISPTDTLQKQSKKPGFLSVSDETSFDHLPHGDWSQKSPAMMHDSADLHGTSGERYAIALWDYSAEDDDSLSLRRGDLIQVVGTDESGWWDGVIGKKRGWFPSNYCMFSQTAGGRRISSDSFTDHQSLVKSENSSERPYSLQSWNSAEIADSLAIRFDAITKDDVQVARSTDGKRTDVAASPEVQSLLRVKRSSRSISKAEQEGPSDGELSFVGFHNRSGYVTPPSDLAPSSRILALDLSSRIIHSYAWQLGKCMKSRGTQQSQDDPGPSSSVSSPVSSARSRETDITMPSMSKRKLKIADETDDDNEDDDGEEETHPKKKRNAEVSVKLFACPFAKYDPERYSERNLREREYRSCSSCLLRDIARLKQHLYRVHRRPDHYCPSCFEAFKSQALLDGHVRQRSCELAEPLYAEKMTKDQMNQIKRRNRGESPVQNWFSIFNTLFPGVTVPVSPYAGEGEGDQVALQHFVHYFRTFGPEQFFNLMRDRQGAVQRLEASTQAIVDEAFEITAPELLRQLQTHRETSSHTSSSAQQPRFEPTISAAEAVSDLLQDETAQLSPSRRQSIDPGHQSGLDTWLQSWGTQDVSSSTTTTMLPEVFDFDTTFDPLTIEDSFDAYGGWLV